MAQANNRKWSARLTWAGAALGLGGVAAALVAAVGSGQELWHFRTGFAVLRWAFFAAAAGAVLALGGAIAAGRTQPRLAVVNLVVFGIAAAFVLYLGLQVRTARSVPAIHDISTNLDDVPAFRRLNVREDNLEDIPDFDRAELAALPPLERWKAVHREHYGDIATIRVPWSVAETTRRAGDLATARGWDVVTYDTVAGLVEAVDTSTFFRFKDDVIVRVRPEPDGSGSLVDMRSISRVGVSDVGVNARRIRAFLSDLQREPV